MNLCSVCGQDFASVSAFDDHRIGRHEHLYSPAHPDGRRCLTPTELEAQGMRKDTRHRWRLPIRGTHPWTSDVTPQNRSQPNPDLRSLPRLPRRRRDTSLLRTP